MKRIICRETGEIWNSIAEAAEDLNMSCMTIGNAIRYDRTTKRGLSFEEFSEEANETAMAVGAHEVYTLLRERSVRKGLARLARQLKTEGRL